MEWLIHSIESVLLSRLYCYIAFIFMEPSLKASLPSWFSGVVVLLVIPFFFIGGPSVFSSTLLITVWNFGHIIFFTVLMLLVQSFKPLMHWQQWLLVTLVALALSSLIEFVQHFVGREASVDDVLHNMFGVWLGLFWGQKPTRLVWVLRFFSLCLLAPSFWLLTTTAVTDVVMRYQFPQINSFDSRYELRQIHAHPSVVETRQADSFFVHGGHSLQVTLSTKRYAGFRLVGPYGDWGGYTYLAMDFYNPDLEPLELILKISDRTHDNGANKFDDRFNRRLQLVSGWNNLRFAVDDIRHAPKNREMQMDEISGLAIFVEQLNRPRDIYWDNIRLED